MRLWLAKSHVSGRTTADVFDGIGSNAILFVPLKSSLPTSPAQTEVEIAGPWGFYRKFWREHDLDSLDSLRAEIAVQPTDTLTIPLRIQNNTARVEKFTVSVVLPQGWKLKHELAPVEVPSGDEITVRIPVIAPAEISNQFAEIHVEVNSGNLAFRGSVFAQVSRNVAEQLK